MRPRFQPTLWPSGAKVADNAVIPAAASRCASSASASLSPANSPACRYGATSRWPDAYGNLLRRTNDVSPRWTTSISSSSPAAARQKTQPSSSSACRMYSSRHGAQSCLVTGRSEPALAPEVAEHQGDDDDRGGDDDPE